jgi:hypothetical protein
LSLKIYDKKVNPIEPIYIHTELKVNRKKYESFGHVGKKWNPQIQVRKAGAAEWINVEVFEPGGSQQELSDPFVPAISLEKDERYVGDWAVMPWKKGFMPSKSNRDLGCCKEIGKYEMRAAYPRSGKVTKMIYSNIETFEILTGSIRNQKIIDYLLNLSEPRFLYDFWTFQSYCKEAEYVYENSRDTSFYGWALFYHIRCNLLGTTEPLNIDLMKDLLEFIDTETNPFLKESGEQLLETINMNSKNKK